MRNVGKVDRFLRAVLGIALLYFAFLSGLPVFEGALGKYGAAAAGAIMLGTALVSVCPIYTVLGLKTCRN